MLLPGFPPGKPWSKQGFRMSLKTWKKEVSCPGNQPGSKAKKRSTSSPSPPAGASGIIASEPILRPYVFISFGRFLIGKPGVLQEASETSIIQLAAFQ